MENKETPLDHLPSGGGNQQSDDEPIAQNILAQMERDNQESERAYQQDQEKYRSSQFGVDPNSIPYMQQQQQQQQQYNGRQGEEPEYEYEEVYEEVPKKKVSFVDRMKREMRMPLVFFVVYVLMCVPFVRRLFMGQVSRFTDNGTYVLWGTTLLSGLVGAVLFYFAGRFV